MGKLVTIIGNSGSGKTTLAMCLAQAGGFQVYLEEHATRPFQAAFALDPRYGLANQVDYLLFRAEQERTIRGQNHICIQDGGLDLDFHMFTRLFLERGYLDQQEFTLLERLYQALRNELPAPDWVIYIDAPLEVLVQRKSARGRKLDVSALADLERMDELLREMLVGIHPDRLLWVDSSREDENYQGCRDRLLTALSG